MAKARHKLLLRDAEVQRWFNNLARGSVITAEERLRRLGRFCANTGHTPQSLVDFKRKDSEEFEKFIMDFVDDSFKKGEKPAQVKNNLVTVKSWLGHFGLKVERKIKLPASDYVDEVVPSKDQLASILRQGGPRARVIAAILAFSGLRPESLGSYLGSDGLRLKDLPELKVEEGKGVVFERVPTIVVVRKTLSKSRHQYFTFLCEEGCQYLKEYLESRMREGEELGPEAPLVGHLRPGKLGFMRTTKLSWEVKLAIKKCGFTFRPYVLRSYCATAFDIAENRGWISHPWRQFFMGHSGDIEARYSTNKGRLAPAMVDEMREAYKKCEALLRTTTSERTDDERIKHAFKEQLMLVAGFSKDEIEKMKLEDMDEEAFQAAIRRRLLGKMASSGPRQKVIAMSEVESHLTRGWEWVAPLPENKAVLRVPL